MADETPCSSCNLVCEVGFPAGVLEDEALVVVFVGFVLSVIAPWIGDLCNRCYRPRRWCSHDGRTLVLRQEKGQFRMKTVNCVYKKKGKRLRNMSPQRDRAEK